MRACTINHAAGAPSTSGRRTAQQSSQMNTKSSPGRRRCRRRHLPAAASASAAAPLSDMQRPAFDIDPSPQKLGGGSYRPSTVPCAVLSAQEVVDALASSPSADPTRPPPLTAFYSSELGGITTEPALAVVHFDDHLVHRGHAVFDTAEIVEGRLYALDDHLARFFRSASAARLRLPFSREQVRRTVIETAAAGRKMDGHVRYWLGAGRGGFGLSSRECSRPSFFVAAYGKKPADDLLLASSTGVDPGGVSLRTAYGIPPPDELMSSVKSTNYLKNALAQAEAEEAGYDYGVFVDGDGFVTEGATVNVGIITAGGELVVPPFEGVSLAGCTASRVLELLPLWLASVPELRDAITSVSRRPLPLSEARSAPHAFVMGSSARVSPVVRWDAEVVSSGAPTTTVLRLRELLDRDRDPTEPPLSPGMRRMHVEVPYGFMTGMLPDRASGE